MSSRVVSPVLMWLISAARAEESPADPPVVELEVVTVTATKTERWAFQIPASVSIIGPERIESEQPQDIGDLLEELPNVEVVSGSRGIGDVTTSQPLTSVPSDKRVATLGLRVPELGLAFIGRARVIKVPADVPATPGYGVCDLYASWLAEGGYSGLGVDFGIDNLTDKAYRRHLSLVDEAGRNFKVSVSYRF